MSNSLDPDQDRHCVGPDLGPKSLQKLSADDTSRQRVKIIVILLIMFLKIFLFVWFVVLRPSQQLWSC